MKTLSRTLLMTALLAVPFVSVQARESQSAHEAWIKAQKIDIKPTLKITETQIPADSAGSGAASPGTGSTGSTGSTPSTNMPSSNMPSSSGGYAPSAPSTPSTGMPQGGAPIYTHPGAKQ